MKQSLELSVIISNYEKAKKNKWSILFCDEATIYDVSRYQFDVVVQKKSFASDMMRVIFQDNNSYLKMIIKIDEQIQSRRFHCDCSMIENKIFQEKVTMYSSRKKFSESTKWILLKRYTTKDLNRVCENCVFVLKFLFEFHDMKLKTIKTKLIELMTTNS